MRKITEVNLRLNDVFVLGPDGLTEMLYKNQFINKEIR